MIKRLNASAFTFANNKARTRTRAVPGKDQICLFITKGMIETYVNEHNRFGAHSGYFCLERVH
jgi:hypothetical protein